MAGHLPHSDRVASHQPDQAAPGLVAGLRIEGQHVVVVEMQEPHQEVLAASVANSAPMSGWLMPS